MAASLGYSPYDYIEPPGAGDPRLVAVDHDPFAPRLVPVEHDPFGVAQAAGALAANRVIPVPRGTAEDALSSLYGMTGVPDIREGAAAFGRGEPLQGVGQMGAGLTALGALAAPVARGAMTLGREAIGAVPGVMADTTGAIRAFHGSPHDFERFDMSKIGTGEGAQAYGHGMYFAEHEPIARGYRDRLSTPPEPLRFEYKGENVYDPLSRTGLPDDIYHGSMELHARSSWTRPEAMTPEYWDRMKGELETTIGNYERAHAKGQTLLGDSLPSEERSLNFARAALNTLKDPEFKIIPAKPSPGRMYEAQINAEPEHFLDWDKPLSEQSDKARQFFDDPRGIVFKPQMTGAEAYRLIDEPGTNAASDALHRAGIPGIRYLDQGSRGAGEGTHNYVVFDDKLIDIIKKYGLGALIAGGAATIPGAEGQAQHLIPVDHDPFAPVPDVAAVGR